MPRINKKYLPIILFVLGVLVLVGAYFLVIKGRGATPEDEDANVPEISLEQRPFTSLTPSEDGHWLKLKIEKLNLEAASLDYELLYKVADGRTQGVPGTVPVKGDALIVRDLLLGSESSGKFRYDEGVTEGTLTLRFRNEKGKLVGKLVTQFHLQSATNILTAFESDFKYQLDKLPKTTFFVTMNTFGLPGPFIGTLSAGPFGVFASDSTAYLGKVEAATHRWNGSSWQALVGGKSSDIGIFIRASE